MIIKSKKDLAAYLDTCEQTRELRAVEKGDDTEGGDGEWPQFREEFIELCFDKEYLKDVFDIGPPPAFGEDWCEWLTKNVDDIMREACSIVL